MAHSYFEIPGISEDTTAEDVKSAYRRLAHQHHPDNLEGDSRNFRVLQEAYDALNDPEQRRGYKAQGSGESTPVWQESPRFGEHFSRIFRSFFF